MARRTPLFEWHKAHGARIVDFAGWDMPVQYTAIVEEHQAVRTGVGIFDISHMGRLFFPGREPLVLIQRIYTNNAASLKIGQIRYGLICNERGGILDDVLVYKYADGYGMVVNASNRERILNWIAAHQEPHACVVQDQTSDTCMVAIQGPKAVETCRGLVDASPETLAYYYAAPTQYRGKPCLVSRTGYTGEDGFEFIVRQEQGEDLWNELVDRGARPCGLGARDTLRLEAGMPLYGHELNEDTDPYQAGLAWAVKLDKGDFVGREALGRRCQDPSLPRRIGLQIEGKRIARENAPVLAAGRAIGHVTSGTFSPTLGRSIAMGYVEPMFAAEGTECSVDIRGNLTPARVTAIPFYRRPDSPSP